MPSNRKTDVPGAQLHLKIPVLDKLGRVVKDTAANGRANPQHKRLTKFLAEKAEGSLLVLFS